MIVQQQPFNQEEMMESIISMDPEKQRTAFFIGYIPDQGLYEVAKSLDEKGYKVAIVTNRKPVYCKSCDKDDCPAHLIKNLLGDRAIMASEVEEKSLVNLLFSSQVLQTSRNKTFEINSEHPEARIVQGALIGHG